MYIYIYIILDCCFSMRVVVIMNHLNINFLKYKPCWLVRLTAGFTLHHRVLQEHHLSDLEDINV